MTDLFLHGFTGSPASFDEIAARLPSSARILRPYLSGHGPEGRTVAGFDAEVDRLARFVRAEAASDLHVLGYSLGARLALGLALRAPELVRRLTLVGASAGIEDEAERHARAAADDALAALLMSEGLEAFAQRWEAQPLFASQAALPEAVRARRQRERRSHDPDALAAALAALSKGRMPPLWSRLPSVTVPVALVVGEHDPKFRAEAERMAARLPHARVHVVASAGHDVGLERPAELAALLGGDA